MRNPLLRAAGRALLGLAVTLTAVPIAVAHLPADPCVAWWRFQHGVTNHYAADHQVIGVLLSGRASPDGEGQGSGHCASQEITSGGEKRAHAVGGR
jgi:hypothetical protein